MIYVNRENIPEPKALTKKNREGKTETERAIEHYTNPGYDGTGFEFKVYSDPEVKSSLIELFKGKCAYCESKFLHVYSGDIEHFRPKGEIEEATPPKKPGYYWLAADWDNLLLSCRNCNQKLTHSVYGINEKRTMGKMNQFPLANNAAHIRDHSHLNGIKDEEPHRLLLNPCIENPELFFEYEQEGVIRPKSSASSEEKARAEKSIDVYVLQRMPLVQSREKIQIDIFAQIQRVKEAIKNFNDIVNSHNSIKKFYFEGILKRELERLRKFTNADEEYAGMARQIIGEFLMVNFGLSI